MIVLRNMGLPVHFVLVLLGQHLGVEAGRLERFGQHGGLGLHFGGLHALQDLAQGLGPDEVGYTWRSGQARAGVIQTRVTTLFQVTRQAHNDTETHLREKNYTQLLVIKIGTTVNKSMSCSRTPRLSQRLHIKK